VSTLSTATPTTWEDEAEVEINGTLPSHLNQSFASLNSRWGIFDLKAPDIDYPGSHFRFVNLSPSIPPRAKILAASIAGAAQDGTGAPGAPQSGVLTARIEVCAPDGTWDVEPSIAARWISGDVTTNPVEIVAQMYTGGPTLVASTTPTGVFSSRLPVRAWGTVGIPRDQKAGEVLTTTAAGTLARVDFNLQRHGTAIAGTANLWAEVWSVSGGLPDALLATSAAIDAGSVSTTAATVAFTFSGGGAIAIANATQYACILNGSYTMDLANYISLQGTAGGGAGQHPVTYGEGRGLCSGNYLGAGQLLEIATIAGSGSVTWNCPAFVLNTVYATPDLSALLQAAVNRPGYVDGDPFLFRIAKTSAFEYKNRGFKTWESPDTPGTVPFVTLSATWRRRRMAVI